jgi:NAD dependent epimerase/dehydratase
MKLRQEKVLVTGADGFIGSHLVEELVARGNSVRAFAMYNSFGKWGWLDRLPQKTQKQLDVVLGDIRDHDAVLDAMRGCSVVMHLAALIAIPFSYRAPRSYVETNIIGTLNVVQAAKSLGVARVIQTSTSEVYGTAQFVPITEQHPLQGQSPYAASKIGADQLAMSFHASFGTPVTILRPFNTYGPRQSARAVIPTIITQIADGSQRIRLGATQPTRDFSFVRDTVNAFIAVAESDAVVGQVINSGSSFEISIGDTARLIADCMGAKIEIDRDTARLRPAASEVERLWADTSKLCRLTDWKPAYGGRDGFVRGLRETIDWFTDSANLAEYKSELYNV